MSVIEERINTHRSDVCLLNSFEHCFFISFQIIDPLFDSELYLTILLLFYIKNERFELLWFLQIYLPYLATYLCAKYDISCFLVVWRETLPFLSKTSDGLQEA